MNRGARVGVAARGGVVAAVGAGGGRAGVAEPAEASVAPVPDNLTPREVDVLRLIAAGHSNAEIAETLYVSDATVKTHINHLLAKTAMRDRAQLVGYAFRNGLATP
jgi:DNA-binding NarL/FixJ family response regulator